MRISDALDICGSDTPRHWSKRLVNHWLFASGCACCYKWRLLVAGVGIGLLPFVVGATIRGHLWALVTWVLFVALFVATGLYNRATEEPVDLGTVKDEGTKEEKSDGQ